LLTRWGVPRGYACTRVELEKHVWLLKNRKRPAPYSAFNIMNWN
jgi:hypothetical protein